jgi:predicted GIY-YIG superfamily endonuclease
MYIVYAQEDQRNNEIFYVGITDDVYARFQQHMRCDGSNPGKDARIQSMKEAGYLPLMRTLQLVPDLEQAKKREAYWMRHFHDLGMPLTNQVMPMVQGDVVIIRAPVPVESRLRLKAKMSPDEQRAYVEMLLDEGLPIRKIIARVEGYIHSDFVKVVVNECMVVPPMSEVVVSDSVTEALVESESVSRLFMPVRVSYPAVPRPPAISDDLISSAVTAWNNGNRSTRRLARALSQEGNSISKDKALRIIREMYAKKLIEM